MEVVVFLIAPRPSKEAVIPKFLNLSIILNSWESRSLSQPHDVFYLPLLGQLNYVGLQFSVCFRLPSFYKILIKLFLLCCNYYFANILGS